MARIDLDIDPVTIFTTDAIGKPGQRVFYIRGTSPEREVTLLCEKVQVQTLSVGIQQFLADVSGRYPNLEQPAGEYQEEDMRIHPPVDPLFRAGEFGIGYEEDHDKAVILAREVTLEGQDAAEVGAVRFWCTRSQLLAFSRWAGEVVNRGRPVCPYCGEPMDPDHFCTKKNGHKH